jgi:hypothetical protein
MMEGLLLAKMASTDLTPLALIMLAKIESATPAQRAAMPRDRNGNIVLDSWPSAKHDSEYQYVWNERDGLVANNTNCPLHGPFVGLKENSTAH